MRSARLLKTALVNHTADAPCIPGPPLPLNAWNSFAWACALLPLRTAEPRCGTLVRGVVRCLVTPGTALSRSDDEKGVICERAHFVSVHAFACMLICSLHTLHVALD
jgi:hypothetical protein